MTAPAMGASASAVSEAMVVVQDAQAAASQDSAMLPADDAILQALIQGNPPFHADTVTYDKDQLKEIRDQMWHYIRRLFGTTGA